MTEKRVWLGLIMGGLLAAAGCSDDMEAPAADAGVKKDGVIADVGKGDMSAPDKGDAALLDQAVADMPVPDSLIPDQVVPDAMQLVPARGVFYSTGSSYNTMTVKQVKIDGTGKAAVPGLLSPFTLQCLHVTGRRGYSNARYDRPTVVEAPSYLHYNSQPTYLSSTLGHLYYYTSVSGSPRAGRGFFVARPDGKAEEIAFGSTSGTSNLLFSYDYHVALNNKGSLMGAGYACGDNAKAAVHLIRTDGTKWSKTGNYVCDVTATAPKVKSIYPVSLTMGAKYLYYIAWDASGSNQKYLFRAPVDCSTVATQVMIPSVGGSAVTSFDLRMGVSEDGKAIFFVAGTSSSNEDVFLLDDATGKVTNVTESPTSYSSPGLREMNTLWYCPDVDVSPDRKYMAYIEKNSPQKVYVRPVDKSKKAVLVKESTNFSSSAIYSGNLRWLNNDLLMFWVGSSSIARDMFTYSVSTGLVTQVTTSGGTTKPYAGGATLQASGWVSPNGKYFIYRERNWKSNTDETHHLRAIDRTTGKLIDIIKDRWLGNEIIGCPKSTRVFISAVKAKSTKPYAHDMYYFDQNAPAAAVKLTSHTLSGTSSELVYGMRPSDDGSMVAYHLGAPSKSAVRVLKVGTPATIYELTKMPTSNTYVSALKFFTPDMKSLVYGLGTSTNSEYDLRIQAIGTGTTAKVLESAESHGSPMMVYK